MGKSCIHYSRAQGVCRSKMAALFLKTVLFSPGHKSNSRVTPSDLDPLISGYRLIQTASSGDPYCIYQHNHVTVMKTVVDFANPTPD